MTKDKASVKIIDMTNVKEGGGTFNKKRVPEGDYLARVVKVQDTEVKNGENKGRFQWLFTISLEKHPSTKYPYYCQIEENQLWKIRNLAMAAGKNVPKKKLKFDPESVVGKLIAVTMEDDEYDGKTQSTIGAIFPPSEMDGGAADDDEAGDPEEDEEKPAKKEKKSKKSKKIDPEPEPEPKKKSKKGKAEPEPEPIKKKKGKKVSDADLEELDISGV